MERIAFIVKEEYCYDRQNKNLLVRYAKDGSYGDICDAVNAVLYLTEGDYINAGLSALSIIPGADAFTKTGKASKVLGNGIVESGLKHLDNVADGIKKLVKKADDAIDLEKHLPKKLLKEEVEAFAKKADKVADDVVEDAAKAIKSGSSSRYDRTGYQSKGRSNNLFGRDRSTRRTTNLTEWRRSISQQDIHNEMRLFLGDDYVKIDSGKWRSLDGTRQFRVKPDDYLGNHGIGQPTVPNTPHVHFEFLTPKSNGNGFDVIKNIHVPIK